MEVGTLYIQKAEQLHDADDLDGVGLGSDPYAEVYMNDNCPRPPGAVKRPWRSLAFSYGNAFFMGLLYGRAGHLTALFGGFRPGQLSGELTWSRTRSTLNGMRSSNCRWLLPPLSMYCASLTGLQWHCHGVETAGC